MGYVPPEFAKADTPIEIEIRGRRAPAVVVPKPIYRKPDSVIHSNTPNQYSN